MTIKINYDTQSLTTIMNDESWGQKLYFAISASIQLAFVVIAGITLCVFWGNQNTIAEAYTGAGNFYNQLPAFYYEDESMRT